MDGSLAEKPEEEIMDELAGALFDYTGSKPLVDFFEIFGERICALDDGTIFSFLMGQANEKFRLKEDDAHEFISSMGHYEVVLHYLPNHGPLLRKELWVGLLVNVKLLPSEGFCEDGIDGEILELLIDRLENCGASDLIHEFHSIFSNLINVKNSGTINFFIKSIIAPLHYWTDAEAETFTESVFTAKRLNQEPSLGALSAKHTGGGLINTNLTSQPATTAKTEVEGPIEVQGPDLSNFISPRLKTGGIRGRRRPRLEEYGGFRVGDRVRLKKIQAVPEDHKAVITSLNSKKEFKVKLTSKETREGSGGWLVYADEMELVQLGQPADKFTDDIPKEYSHIL